ncbi:hypothetical protein BFW01_g11755 [Lasiodiplodia theobromae]|nr:hypothetical protein BFW01_g11755 [Lasiodiplodia theobromae]
MADAWAERTLANLPVDDSPDSRRVVELLQSLLNRTTSPQETAESLASLYDPHIKSGRTNTAALWSIYCTAISDIEHDESSFSLLIETLLSLARLPDVVDNNGQPFKENGNLFWRELPEFPFWLSQGPASPVSVRDMRNNPQRLTRSMRAAKFGALYLRELDRQPIEHTPRGPRDGMRDVGLNTIVGALRWEVESESDVEQARLAVPQAATWIVTAGRSLFQAAKERFSIGPDCTLDMDMWNLWKGRYAALAGFEGADAELRRVAGEAADEMQRIEREA